MEVVGYKCFNEDLTNNYGKKFAIGQIYIATGALKFGNNGNGFHMCKNIEDTFRYFCTDEKDICVCEVIGSGNIVEQSDEYNGYYDMYCVQNLKLMRQLTREELIEIGLTLSEYRVKRFISTLSLTQQEVELFKKKFKNNIDVLDLIAYYQENDKDVYFRKLKVKQ